MLEALVSVLGGSVGGSIIGGVFGFLNRKEERKQKEADNKFQLAMIAAGANADQQTSEARAFEESQKSKSSIGDAIKSAVRPVITGILLFQTYIILTNLEKITGGIVNLPEGEALQLYREIVLNIIALTSTSVSWWFASRPASKSKQA